MFAQRLQEDLTGSIQKLFTKLQTDYQLPVVKAAEEWSKNINVVQPTATAAPKAAATTRKKADPNGPKCVYVYQKGKRPGQSCGDPVCADSTSYCRKHLKYEGGGATKSSSVMSAAKEIAAGVTTTTAAKPRTAATQLAVTQNAYGNYEHKATNLVFNREKMVFGKQVGDKVLSLSSGDVDMCTRMGFKYLPESVAKPESTDPTVDEEVADEDPEVEEVEEEVEEEAAEEEEVEEVEVVEE